MSFSSTSASHRRLFTMRHPAVVDVGCSCRRAKLKSLFSTSSSSFSSSSTATTAALTKKKKTKPPPPQQKAKPNPHTPSNHRHPLSSYYPFSPSTATAASSATNATTTTTVSVSPWDYTSSLNPSLTSTTATSPYNDYYYSYYNASYYSGCGYSDHSSVPSSGKLTSSLTKKKAAGSATIKEAAGGRVAEESVAVVKESADPYHDFRDSMLQMIMEKEIYAWDELRDLLNRFLSLNSPYHHDSIVRAFTEIWNGVFCAGDAAVAGGARRRKKKQHYQHQQQRQHGHHHRLSRDPPDYGA